MPRAMSAITTQPADVNDEALSLLREAWRHLQSSERLIGQARRNPTDRVVIEGLLILALEHAEKSRAAIEHAAKLLTISSAAKSRL